MRTPFFKTYFLRFQFNTVDRTSFSTFSIFGFRFRVDVFIGFQEIHLAFSRVQLRGKKRLFDLPKGIINVTDGRTESPGRQGPASGPTKIRMSSRILRFCSMFAVLGGLQNSLPVGLFARELARNTASRGARFWFSSSSN